MSRSRYRVRSGIVVRRTPLPSGDVVVTLLSDDGKWRAVVRKGRRLGGNPGRLSLFHDVEVQAYQRRDDDLAVVTQVRLAGALSRLADPSVYPFAHLLAELAERLSVDGQGLEPLHAWLASGLRGLDRDPDPERVALIHAWMLLRVAGLAPDLSAAERNAADSGDADPGDADLERPPEAPLRFDVAGGRVARGGAGTVLSPAVWSGFRLLAAGRPRDALNDAIDDRPSQWRMLARYVAWHVADLRSLEALTPGATADAAGGPDRDAPLPAPPIGMER
ncbi:MAG: DNA repair protein RecO C-terminal domain-containing protein [Trueperaceae bacterium]